MTTTPQVIRLTGGASAGLSVGANDIDSVDTDDANAVRWDLLLVKGSVRRLLSVYATHDNATASAANTTRATTGGTVDVTVAVVLTGGNLVLRLTPASSGWQAVYRPATLFASNAPYIASVTPNYGAAAGGAAVTLSGANFTGVTGVTFGGAPATSVVVVNDTTITCVTPAGTLGGVTVAATGPGGTGSLAQGFYYRTAETLALVNGETDWPTNVLDAMDTFWETTGLRAAIGTTWLVWWYTDLDITRAIRPLWSNAGALSIPAHVNVGQFVAGDLTNNGLKGNGLTKYITTSLTQSSVGITTSSGFQAVYTNKQVDAALALRAYGGSILTGGGSATHLYRDSGGGNGVRLATTAAGFVSTAGAAAAWYAVSRYDSSNLRRDLDGTFTTHVSASTVPTADTISSHARTTNNPTNESLKFQMFGGRAMSEAEMSIVRTAVLTFMATLGKLTA